MESELHGHIEVTSKVVTGVIDGRAVGEPTLLHESEQAAIDCVVDVMLQHARARGKSLTVEIHREDRSRPKVLIVA